MYKLILNKVGIAVLVTFLLIGKSFSQTDTIAFANGADISWLSEMEASGYTFYNSQGVQDDCMQILKDKGINSLRFRVWVNPTEVWSSKDDMTALAMRAHDMGFRIMIDFHYSDWWADPGKQNKPAAWANDSMSQLITHIYEHTYDVLDTLKSVGITPEWVQVGNETNNGMLWPDGKASEHMGNFADMVNSGYDAVKAVDSTISVIVHISNGYDNGLFRWIFDGLKNNGAHWDIIAMSLYPGTDNWSSRNNLCLTNMKDMVKRYGKPVMIAEVGMPYSAANTCNAFLIDLINKVKSVEGGLGVFYWEPQCYNWKGYNLGAWSPSSKQPTVAMDAFLGIPATSALADNKSSGLGIYPNPMYGNERSLKISGLNAVSTIRIINQNGQLMSETVVEPYNQLAMIAPVLLPPGDYFVLVNNNSQKLAQSLVIR